MSPLEIFQAENMQLLSSMDPQFVTKLVNLFCTDPNSFRDLDLSLSIEIRTLNSQKGT